MKKIKKYKYYAVRKNERCTCEMVRVGISDETGDWCLVCGGVIRTLEEIERDMNDIEAGEVIPGRDNSGLPLKQGLKQKQE